MLGIQSEEDIRNIYDTYLYHFNEIFSLNKANLIESQKKTKIKEILDYDPKFIKSVPVIYAQEDDNNINEKINDAMKFDLVILRNFLPKLKFNNYLFTHDYLLNNYGNLKIDVLEQDKCLNGFSDYYNVRDYWNLKDYVNYVFNRQNNIDTSDLPVNQDKVYFAVNVDMDKIITPVEEIKNKLFPEITFGSYYDALSYVQDHIRGMTIPQYYLKEKGVWTGGHEENLRIRSVNINHCGGDSEWYGLSLEDSSKFHSHILKKESKDIYKNEGLWFVNYEYFIKNKMNVLYTIQKPGDIVLVGPGVIHWYILLIQGCI